MFEAPANVAVFSVCNLAYLNKALVLAESLLAHGGPMLNIYLFDKKIDVELPVQLANFVWVEDLGLENFAQYAFKYDITEFSTSLKPYLALRLLDTAENVIFLDPDTCLYHNISPILDCLENSSIVLTPHYMQPHVEGDLGMMRFGSFNLGFFAVNRTPEAKRFLQWWNERCLDLCYFETQFGLSTDQKWVSIAPCLFQNIHISFDVGFNAAFWNVHERSFSVDELGHWWVNGSRPLVFFHFSSFDEKNPSLLSKRDFPGRADQRVDYQELASGYNASLQRMKSELSEVKYGFDYMSDGGYISPTFRRAYAAVLPELPAGHDPFDASGAVATFGKKNHLLTDGVPYRAAGFSDASSHHGKFKAINTGLRLVLRLIGPNRFMNLSRLFVYLSSYRLNKDLWKL